MLHERYYRYGIALLLAPVRKLTNNSLFIDGYYRSEHDVLTEYVVSMNLYYAD